MKSQITIVLQGSREEVQAQLTEWAQVLGVTLPVKEADPELDETKTDESVDGPAATPPKARSPRRRKNDHKDQSPSENAAQAGSEPAQAPAQTEQPAAPPPTVEPPAPAAPSSEPAARVATKDHINDALAAVMETQGLGFSEGLKLLKRFGASRLGELKTEDYLNFVIACEEAIAQQRKAAGI